VVPQFLRAAKIRLLLLALERGATHRGEQLPSQEDLFPLIQQNDGLVALEVIPPASAYVLNPPFGYMETPADCDWSSGRVSVAAVFVAKCVEVAPPGSKVIAILPDVLRSGSRYRKWRSYIQTLASVDAIDVHGVFDIYADVDVFILRLTKRTETSGKSEWHSLSGNRGCRPKVGEFFHVHVGAVVPHRHRHEGTSYSYIQARMLPPWESFDADSSPHRRCFSGRTFRPPFVAVRRTSSPRDKNRVVATLVVGDSNVAVENHLLVLCPRETSLGLCQALMQALSDERTSEWLGRRIRCRHFTVSSIQDLPWWIDQ